MVQKGAPPSNVNGCRRAANCHHYRYHAPQPVSAMKSARSLAAEHPHLAHRQLNAIGRATRADPQAMGAIAAPTDAKKIMKLVECPQTSDTGHCVLSAL